MLPVQFLSILKNLISLLWIDIFPAMNFSISNLDPWENDYIAFAEYYNEPIGRSFGNCEIPFVTS